MTDTDSGKNISYSERIFASLYNPFSIKNTSPKYPDGLANFSTGIKRQHASEVYGRDLVICLFPGKQNWCQCYEWDETDNRLVLWANHGVKSEAVCKTAVINDPTSDRSIVPDQKWNNWRCCGVALKIECANNDEDHDGWFECIRTDRNATRHRFGILTFTDFPATGSHYSVSTERKDVWITPFKRNDYYIGHMLPSNATVQEWYSARNWALMPSYASGKLKNIDNYVFCLNPNKDDNEFVKTKPVSYSLEGIFEEVPYEYPLDDYDGVPPTKGTAAMVDANLKNEIPTMELNENNTLPDDFYEIPNFEQSFMSQSWDMIIIRIHGIDATRLSLHSVSNLELTCNEFSEESRYLTPAYPDTDKLAQWRAHVTKERKIPFFKPSFYWE